MIRWISNLFKKKKPELKLFFYEVELQNKLSKRHNVRDKKGRFTKKK